MSSARATCLHCELPVVGKGEADEQAFCCVGCRWAFRLAGPQLDGEAGPGSGRDATLLIRFGTGLFLAMNIAAFSWLFYGRELFGAVSGAGEVHGRLESLFAYLALFLCTLVIVLLAGPIVGNALEFRDDRWVPRARLDSQGLIAIGVLAAFLLSAYNTVRGAGSLYFDTAAMVLVIVTLGSLLEARARSRAHAAAQSLSEALPRLVKVNRVGMERMIDRREVEVGDLVRVVAGDTIPVDGVVVEGLGGVDEASLTGESAGRVVEPGDVVLAGSVSLDGQLRITVTRTGDDTVFAQTEAALIAARAIQPPIQRLADRVARAFLPVVLLLALGTFGVRVAMGNIEAGVLSALSVLLISCPCALGLAAPLAAWSALRRGARSGLLIDSAVTLERAAAVRRVFFDKTGTLTEIAPALDYAAYAQGVRANDALRVVTALEAASHHPIARAWSKIARDSKLFVEAAESVTVEPGRGLAGEVEGKIYRLGSERWMNELGLAPEQLSGRASAQTDSERRGSMARDANRSSVYLADGERVLARFELVERLRPGVSETVGWLRDNGFEVSILSGDRHQAVETIAKSVGVEGRGGLLPADKVSILDRARRARPAGRARRARDRGVLMVGDGLNDAPVLAAADVGVAIGSASDLAARSGNVRLVDDGLDGVVRLLALARETRSRIRSNLAWAFAFNSIGIVLAVVGWLTPVFAAFAMVVSSLTVVRISTAGGSSRAMLRADASTEPPARRPWPSDAVVPEAG